MNESAHITKKNKNDHKRCFLDAKTGLLVGTAFDRHPGNNGAVAPDPAFAPGPGVAPSRFFLGQALQATSGF